MRVFASIDEFTAAAGEALGHSEWHEITQEQVNLFADATGDHQWIHIDPARAADGPFGTTIAHGYLTVSLLPALAQEIYRVDGIAMAINYGLNRLRFPSPVPVGSRVRASAEILDVSEVAGGVQAVMGYTVEVDGSEKPSCVAETVVRYLS